MENPVTHNIYYSLSASDVSEALDLTEMIPTYEPNLYNKQLHVETYIYWDDLKFVYSGSPSGLYSDSVYANFIFCISFTIFSKQ